MKRDWLQIFSNFAIVLGLVIVVYELNQTKDLAYAQMQVDGSSSARERFHTLMGDDPRSALAKASLQPDELDDQEIVALDAFYQSWWTTWLTLVRTNDIADLDRPWRYSIASQARVNFSSEPGRQWLKRLVDEEIDPRFPVLHEVANIAFEAVSEDYNYIKDTKNIWTGKRAE